jgi:hypothetical protein
MQGYIGATRASIKRASRLFHQAFVNAKLSTVDSITLILSLMTLPYNLHAIFALSSRMVAVRR